MNQIELEKIADAFDKDRSGVIDLSEIIGVFKGGSRQTRRPMVQEAVTDNQKIDNEVSVGCMILDKIEIKPRGCLAYREFEPILYEKIMGDVSGIWGLLGPWVGVY